MEINAWIVIDPLCQVLLDNYTQRYKTLVSHLVFPASHVTDDICFGHELYVAVGRQKWYQLWLMVLVLCCVGFNRLLGSRLWTDIVMYKIFFYLTLPCLHTTLWKD